MDRNRIMEMLEAYRPGEGLETEPEVKEALRRSEHDPEIAEALKNSREFDAVFASRLREIRIPADLKERILSRTPVREPGNPSKSPFAGKIIRWIHPAALAAAATIVILLALSFTYWPRPQTTVPANPNPDERLMATAHSLYRSLNPAMRNAPGPELIEYLRRNGGSIPVNLPSGFAWDKSFACDVVDIDGTKVSIICFKAPDDTRSMHLFTFHRSAFPGLDVPDAPRIHSGEGPCCATWRTGEAVHVLFSDNGEENLRAVLDI